MGELFRPFIAEKQVDVRTIFFAAAQHKPLGNFLQAERALLGKIIVCQVIQKLFEKPRTERINRVGDLSDFSKRQRLARGKKQSFDHPFDLFSGLPLLLDNGIASFPNLLLK